MISISKAGEPSLVVSLDDTVGTEFQKERLVKEDCIDVPEYTKKDGTKVVAHKRCIDRLITVEGEAYTKEAAEARLGISLVEQRENQMEDLRQLSDQELKDELVKSGWTSPKNRIDDSLQELSPFEQHVINKYTRDYRINKRIRFGILDSDDPYVIEVMNRALAKHPYKVRAGQEVYRILVPTFNKPSLGVVADIYEQNVGKVVNFEAFSSSTGEIGWWSEQAYGVVDRDILFEILPKDNSEGVLIDSVSFYPDETEVLFPTDTKFMVEAVEEAKDIHERYLKKIVLREI